MLTWYRRHPVVPPAAEELHLGRQLSRFVEGAVEYIDEVACIRLEYVVSMNRAKRVKRTPCCHGKPPTPYSSSPLPHSEQNSRCKTVPEPLSAS